MDDLTGLLNKKAFYDEVAALLEYGPGNRALLVFIDLDSFKAINDTPGHLSGDHPLKITKYFS